MLRLRVFNRIAAATIAAIAVVGISLFIPAFGYASAYDSVIDAGAVSAFVSADGCLRSNGFSAELNGTVKARVFGIPYTQRVSVVRKFDGAVYEETAESASALVKAGIKKRYDGAAYYVSSAKFRRGKFEYGKEATLGQGEYESAYGPIKTGLIKYDVAGNILSARLVCENAYEFELECSGAAKRTQCEFKTILGAEIKYESIKFTLYTDGQRPVRTEIDEVFVANKFGGVKCTAHYTEVYS